MGRKFRLPKPIGKETEFTWGPVVKVHSIEALGIDVVEYHPGIHDKEKGSHTGKYETERTQFHPYVYGRDSSHSYESLTNAILFAFAMRRHGWAGAGNGGHAHFAAKCLDLSDGENIIADEFKDKV